MEVGVVAVIAFVVKVMDVEAMETDLVEVVVEWLGEVMAEVNVVKEVMVDVAMISEKDLVVAEVEVAS